MKKWVAGFFILLAVLLASSYVLIPNGMVFRETITIPTNPSGFYRTFFESTDWTQWWPGEKKGMGPANKLPLYSFNGETYTLVEKRINALAISISNPASSTATLLNLVPVNPDSVQLIWIGESTLSANPFKRLKAYVEFREIQADMNILLKQIKSYYSNPDHIYGLHIQQVVITDSLLIATNRTTKGYPDNELIYGLIQQLQAYAWSQSAKQTGYPMLHITTTDSAHYLTRVALPVERRLNSAGTISFKWMMGGGAILVTEVKGGPASIQHAFHQMDAYVMDHNRTMPAIPFQSLITNRLVEKDSSKWITRVYFPVR